MRAYILQHIDGIIAALLGLLLCIVTFRKPPRRRHRGAGERRVSTILRICSPVILLFGLARMVPLPDQSLHQVAWQRNQIGNGAATVEFPSTPEIRHEADPGANGNVDRTTLVLEMPERGISLRLSSSTVRDDEKGLTDAQRFAALKQYFIKQGFTRIEDAQVKTGATEGYELAMQKESGGAKVWLRVTILSGTVYRAVASNDKDGNKDPLIAHFLDSFQTVASDE